MAPNGSSSVNAANKPGFMSGVKQQTLQILSNSLSIARMKFALLTLLAVALFAPAASARKPHCMFRVHAQANERDTEVFASAIKAKASGKDVAIEKAARITEDEVVAFTLYQAPDGTLGALLQLDEHGRLALDAVSVEHRGQHLFIFLNGRPLTELLVDKRVSDGKIYIPSGITVADLRLMKKDWKLITPKDKQEKKK